MDLAVSRWQVVRQHFHWARLVSDMISPPVLWGLLAFPIAFRATANSMQAILWALAYGVLVCLMPMLYVAWQVRSGGIADLHMPNRHERIRPLLMGVAGAGIALILFLIDGAPRLMPLFTVSTLLQMLLITVITLWWQISIHTMSAAVAAVTIGVLYGALPGLLLVPLVILVGVARLKLDRHTPAQVVAGAVLGVVLTGAVSAFV